ncbi:MAG: alanine--tRNA ligase-related protein, partial [Dictyoglomus sp.]|nr:alanine--tRNA ligase-related protein [Dictyoglomus sp.]MDW8189334.1 alanine--tRNA ligase-related protein [Dictyoglomus sp.]
TKTEFLGYTNNEVETTVEAIIKDGVTVNFLEEGQEGEIFLKETPFYAEAGGQVGDTGVIISPYGKAEVLDTKRILGLHCHIVRVTEGVLN